ncbi:hypothetical protein ACWGJ9_11235 [Curtobacterium citreum]
MVDEDERSAPAAADDRAERSRRWSVGVAILAPLTAVVVLVSTGLWLLGESVNHDSRTGGFGVLATALMVGAVLPAAAGVFLLRLQRGLPQRRYAGIVLAFASTAVTAAYLGTPFVTAAVPAEVAYRQSLLQPLTASETQDRQQVRDRLEQVYRQLAEEDPGLPAVESGSGEWREWAEEGCDLSNRGDGTRWYEYVGRNFVGENSTSALDSVEAAAEVHGYDTERVRQNHFTTRVDVTTRWGTVSASGTDFDAHLTFNAETVCVR